MSNVGQVWQACIQDREGDNRDWDACLWLIGGGGGGGDCGIQLISKALA